MKRYREHYVYKYTNLLTGRIVYIGKTNCSLKARIDAHKREASFLAYSDLYVEFTCLSNEVETDSVEKLLINYYKPRLNTKDKVAKVTEGLALPNLAWHPYEVYLKELETNKFKRREVALKTAQIDTEFLYDCLGCREDGGKVFSTHLHPNGTLPFGSKNKQITNKEVVQCGDVFTQTLEPGLLEELLKKENQIMMDIWMPVIQYSNLSENTLKAVNAYEKVLEFASVARWFEYQGYRMDDYSELCELKVPSSFKETLMCFGKYVYSEWNGLLTIEWGDEDHNKLNKNIEAVAHQVVVALKSSGIIEYGYTN